MKKMIFGSRHKRFLTTDDYNPSLQLKLDLDAETIAACKITDVKKLPVISTQTEVTFNKPKPKWQLFFKYLINTNPYLCS
ncbi:MAG: hypothetical protein H7Y86_04340 [Rhizobacter sp.]|nr:hypothetical protein [Ferruginibacter sp.]